MADCWTRRAAGIISVLMSLIGVMATPPSCRAEERSDLAVGKLRPLVGQGLLQLRDEDPGATETLGAIADLTPSLAVNADAGLPPVVGAWYRQLAQLRSSEQYDLLYEWTMPTVDRRTVRNLTSLVPRTAPPNEFARAIGERPNSRSFPIAEVNGVRGLFSTGWLLVQAARETARLDSLIDELTVLAEQQVAGADSLLLLARVAAADERDDELLAELKSRAAVPYGKAPVAGEVKTPAGQVWQFGYSEIGNDRLKYEFRTYPAWTGGYWQGRVNYPNTLGWSRLDAIGGHTDTRFMPIRRWTAPADGELAISGSFKHIYSQGDGIRGRVFSSRSGLIGEWTALGGAVDVSIPAVTVRAGDTIDFVADLIENPSWDHFEWPVQLVLKQTGGDEPSGASRQQSNTVGSVVTFDSTKADIAPRLQTVLSEAVLAAACFDRPWLRTSGYQLLTAQTYFGHGLGSPVVAPFLQEARAVAVMWLNPEFTSDTLREEPLKSWIVASGEDAVRHAAGAERGIWLSHQGHVTHLSGPRSSSLLFRYPLSGEFEFSVEAQQGGAAPTDGCLTYNGLQILAHLGSRSLTIHDVDSARYQNAPAPFLRRSSTPESDAAAFNRLSIRADHNNWTFLVNGHPVWEDRSGSTSSPWLGLRAFGDRNPVFRNLRLAGSPEIPREVRLIGNNSMRGWQSTFFQEGQPTFATQPPNEDGSTPFVVTPDIDWFVVDGLLIAEKVQTPSPINLQSLLRYHRPLLDGETLTYEFMYTPDETLVHPAVGRLAFLLTPSGIRAHWITDGEHEWTGLEVDNAIIEPVFRRARPQLKTDDWNQMQVAIADGAIRLTLNSEVIYERPLESSAGTQFGLFRNPLDSGVQVRNVVLTGGWPESLPDDLLAPARDLTVVERHIRNAVLGEPVLVTNITGVLQHTATLPDEERFEFLSDYVLPGRSHNWLRVNGEFTPSESPVASPPARGEGENRSQLASPALDLIDTAARLGRLDEVYDKVKAFKRTQEQQQRARLAMLILIDVARGELEAASDSVDQLLARTDSLPIFDHRKLWPETLVVFRGVQTPQTKAIVEDLLLFMTSQVQQWRYTGSYIWDKQVLSLLHLDDRKPLQFGRWHSGTVMTAMTHGAGNAITQWGSFDWGVGKASAHDFDLLHYQLPLRGNFDVEVDATVGTFNTGLMFAGEWDALENAKEFVHGNPLTHTKQDLERPLSRMPRQGRLRLRVRDGVCTTIINGVELHSRQLPENHDPWLSIYSRGRHLTRVSSVEITGSPVIPESVSLVTDEALSGWIPYYGTGIGTPESDFHWSPSDAGEDRPAIGIFGKKDPLPRGSCQERLLQYYRPVIGNESVEYEFLYEPEATLTHPAVDQLAFLITADGIVEHEVTDGQFGGIDAEPGNQITRPDFRRGPSTLPLLVSEWNHMKLQFDDDSLQLILNDELVYERPLGADAARTFGLFHYSDQTEASVRNVVLRGDWPRSVPTRQQQELATSEAVELDQDLPRLTSVFQHNFAEGVDETYFTATPGDARIQQRPDGFRATVSRPGRWMHAGLIPRFSLRGDFDVETSFDIVQAQGDHDASVALVMHFADERKHYAQLVRSKSQQQHQIMHTGLSFLEGDARVYEPGADNLDCEATSGRLRLARRGSTLWYLFAAGDSESFQVIAKTDAPTADTEIRNSIQLRAVANGDATSSVTFRDVTIRAEKLLWFDESQLQGVAIINADGTGFRQITGIPPGMRNLGSPEWSPDGKAIAFDSSISGTPNSHIFTVNVDTGDVYDCGEGCMPSYSADGKRMAYTFPGFGVGTMDLMGRDRKLIERSAWSAMWSPNGRYICWGYAGNIIVYDVETKERTQLLVGEQATMYSYTYWNPAWSHDSRWICFKGRNRQTGGEDIVVAAIDSDEFKVILPSTRQVHTDFAWHPDNKRVLIPFDAAGNPHTRLYYVDRTTNDPPQLFPGQPENWHLNHCNFSLDGKQIAVTGYKDLEPVEWKGRPVDRNVNSDAE